MLNCEPERTDYMMNIMTKLLVCAALSVVDALLIVPARTDVPAMLAVEVNKPGVAIPGSFYGLMTEEINHSYDGGLFAELIQNRTFQDPAPRGAADNSAESADPLVARRRRHREPRSQRTGECRPAGQPRARHFPGKWPA